MGRQVMFSQMCVCSGRGGGTLARTRTKVPHPIPPSQDQDSVHPSPSPKQEMPRTGYSMGGIYAPCVFAQEDFLVKYVLMNGACSVFSLKKPNEEILSTSVKYPAVTDRRKELNFLHKSNFARSGRP